MLTSLNMDPTSDVLDTVEVATVVVTVVDVPPWVLIVPKIPAFPPKLKAVVLVAGVEIGLAIVTAGDAVDCGNCAFSLVG